MRGTTIATDPAFPLPRATVNDHSSMDGMTLREWYAGQALAGILSNPTWNQESLALAGIPAKVRITDVAATMAFEYADAMLAEAAKGGGK